MLWQHLRAVSFIPLFVALAVVTPYGVDCQDPDHPGTTKNIEQIFIGRCFDYQEVRYKDVLPRVQTSCQELWKLFKQSFSYRPPCYVTMNSYDVFYQASRQALPEDKVLFWSGVYKIAHEFSDGVRRLITLEDTLLGYLVNSLVWCGQSVDPGLNYTRCPAWTDCPQEAAESFWAGASKTFASEARGSITLILDGSNADRPAYRRDSFFGKFELPNLSTDKVTAVEVILVHNLTANIVDDCKSGNIAMLAADLKSRGFDMTCEDNPESILFLLCSEDPSNRECQTVKQHMMGLMPQQKLNPVRHINHKPDDIF